MLLLSDNQIDRVIHNHRRMFFGGLAWFALMLALPIPKPFKIGFFTSFAILGYGEFAFVLQRWRTDRGLWMLAMFLAVMYALIVGALEYEQIRPLLKPAGIGGMVPNGWDEFRLAVDGTFCLLVFGKFVRFAFSVAVRNWQLTHSPRSTEPPPNDTNYLD